MTQPSIECKVDGPYLVRDLALLANSKGEAIACKPVMALCRCGGSATKPFCDGTHKKNGFSGAKQAAASPAKRDTYRGKNITIHDDRAICAHSARCTDELAAVFQYGSEPWIDPDGASAQAVIEAIRKCPSGALSYSIEDVEASPLERAAGITVTKDGPYAVVGAMALTGQDTGAMASSECYTLCRCGASKNKPFCDGSHWGTEFRDPTT